MTFNLQNTLVIGISTTALFDLSVANTLFQKELQRNPNTAIDIYSDFMLKNEDITLEKGIGYPLINALLHLNRYQKNGEKPLVEVVIISRNSPDTGVQVLNSIRKLGLNITRSAFTAGKPCADYLEAFDIDLFLTTDEADAQEVIDNSVCASAVLNIPPEYKYTSDYEQVRIAFDGDAVLFDESSELVYKEKGIEEFHKNETKEQNTPMNKGPFAAFLMKLAKLQKRLPMKMEFSPVRIAIVTDRNAPSDLRVIKTLRHWDVTIDEAFFLGGLKKSKILKSFKAHIFFDDQEVHLKNSSLVVPSGKVLYPSHSKLNTNF